MAAPQLFEATRAVQADAAIGLELIELAIAEPVDIGGAGHAIEHAWDGADGATAVEVTEAEATLWPAVAETLLTERAVTAHDGGWRFDLPAGARLRAIGLVGFQTGDGTPIVDAPPPAECRVIVAFAAASGSGFDSPRFAVPRVGRRGAMPAALGGAELAAGTLTLDPAVAARRARVTLVNGDTPPEFAAQPSSLSAVNLLTHTPARRVRLAAPDGRPLWETAEFDPEAPPARVDLRQPLQTAFTRQLRAGAPLRASFSLVADAPARCRVVAGRARGALLRVHAGIATTRLEGEPAPIAAFGAGGPIAAFGAAALAAETPSAVSGDLSIRYAGLRLLDAACDALPEASAERSGRVVSAAGALRVWAARALVGQRPARIGVFGRAPEACELALELVEARGETVGATLAGPALLTLDASAGWRTHWAAIEVDAPLPADVGLRLRCNVGRFFWAAHADGAGIARVAVRDPDPGGRPLRLAGFEIARVDAAESQRPGFAFPVAAFRGRVPLLDSPLFLQVDCSDLTLRYAR